MITEQDIRAIYEGFYKVVELVGEPDITHEINYELHLLLTNLISPETKEKAEKRQDLMKITHSLKEEYYPKFEELSIKQRTLEAKA